MTIRLDECLDWRFGRHLAGHDVESAQAKPWRGLPDGELLRRAAQRFDAFVAADRNLAFQQPIEKLAIAIAVLKARSNDLDGLLPLVPAMLKALETAKPGEVCWIEAAWERLANALRQSFANALAGFHGAGLTLGDTRSAVQPSARNACRARLRCWMTRRPSRRCWGRSGVRAYLAVAKSGLPCRHRGPARRMGPVPAGMNLASWGC